MTVAVSAFEGVELWPMTREAYGAAVEAGAFLDERVELLEGALVRMSPQGPMHAGLMRRLTWLLARGLPEGYELGPGTPFDAGALSVPEPDIAVIPAGKPLNAHPDTAVLLIEVSRSSLAKDLRLKARIYAAAGVPTYWVIDVDRELTHVHTGPQGDGYTGVDVVPFTTSLEVLGVRVVLSELLSS